MITSRLHSLVVAIGAALACVVLAVSPASAAPDSGYVVSMNGVQVADPGRVTGIVRAELEQQSSLYAAIWEQTTGPAWQARHGLTAGQYQQTFDELNAQGYRLVSVSGYNQRG